MDEHLEPEAEEPQRFPGGPDSLADEGKYGEIPEGPVIPDLPPNSNPAVDVDMPVELQEPEKSDEPTSDGASDTGEPS